MKKFINIINLYEYGPGQCGYETCIFVMVAHHVKFLYSSINTFWFLGFCNKYYANFFKVFKFVIICYYYFFVSVFMN